jgi:hypothetical protein
MSDPRLVRPITGLVKVLDLTGVPDGIELNGFRHWVVYQNGGAGNGFWEIRGGELRTKATLAWAMALWGDPDVGLPGHCVQAEVCSPGFTGADPTPGVVANGALDHSEDTRVVVWSNAFEWRERAGADWGSGFAITTGATGIPFTNNTFHALRMASVQQIVGGTHARGGLWVDLTEVQLFDLATGIGTGINDGSRTYPGVISWQSAGTRIRNYRVYRDYRITVDGLTGTQGFRVYDSGGSVLLESNAQSGNRAWVDAGTLDWPFTGYLQVFNDAGTWADPVALNARYPESGTDSFSGGDFLEYATRTFGFQVNFLQTPNWPDEWDQPYGTLPALRDCEVSNLGSMGDGPRGVVPLPLPRRRLDLCPGQAEQPAGAPHPARPAVPLRGLRQRDYRLHLLRLPVERIALHESQAAAWGLRDGVPGGRRAAVPHQRGDPAAVFRGPGRVRQHR